jgi:hypothetical protein
MQNKLREKRKCYMMGPNECHHPKKEKMQRKICVLYRGKSSKLLELMYIISYLCVDPWALRLYHPEALLYSLRRSRRLYSGAEGWYNGAEGWYNLNAHG